MYKKAAYQSYASLIFGVLSFAIFGFILSILAIIFGLYGFYLSFGKNNKLSIISLLGVLLGIIVRVLLPTSLGINSTPHVVISVIAIAVVLIIIYKRRRFLKF